ncbi:MAG: Mth938-like domain-containing protein [Gemmatimonadota bacterium]
MADCTEPPAGRRSPGSPASPEIVDSAWGRIELDDGRTFKDVKLWPGGGREWDWTETGTGHRAGIQPADVDELLEHGAEVVVLAQGRLKALSVAEATVARLERAGVETVIAPTAAAIRRYNALRKERPVGGLFHSSC